MVRNADFSQYRETMVFHICRYLFAKGVEGVILWGGSKDGKIYVYFHHKHFTDKFETEVPAKYHSLVEDSMKTGVSLFKAHQEWVIQKQNAKAEIDLSKEIEEVIKWIPRFGIAFALHNKYQALLADPLDTSKQ